MTGFLQRGAKKTIPAELLSAAVEAVAKLPEEERRDRTSRVVALLRIMDAHKVPSAHRGDLSRAIQFRLQALAALQDQPSYRAWSRKRSMHAALIEAAASVPLFVTDRVASFEPQSFFKRVLEIAEARGPG